MARERAKEGGKNFFLKILALILELFYTRVFLAFFLQVNFNVLSFVLWDRVSCHLVNFTGSKLEQKLTNTLNLAQKLKQD